MEYRADVTVDLTFHNPAALCRVLANLGGGSGDVTAWGLVARISEFADARLDGLHLTGAGCGKLLLDHHPHLLSLLARHADGVITVDGEDGARWQIGLSNGTATVRQDESDVIGPAAALGATAPPATGETAELLTPVGYTPTSLGAHR